MDLSGKRIPLLTLYVKHVALRPSAGDPLRMPVRSDANLGIETEFQALQRISDITSEIQRALLEEGKTSGMLDLSARADARMKQSMHAVYEIGVR